MFFYTYILRSKKDGLLYTGCTKDLKNRFEQHEKGEVKSTKDRRPLELIYYEACKSNIDARHREVYLKNNYGKMFLKNRLKDFLATPSNKNTI